MLQNFFKSKNMSKKLKLILKNTTIDKMFTYASETWTLTKRDRKELGIFERKVYRIILGTEYDNEERKLEDMNPLKPELNPICYLLALLGAHHFLHVSRIRAKY